MYIPGFLRIWEQFPISNRLQLSYDELTGLSDYNVRVEQYFPPGTFTGIFEDLLRIKYANEKLNYYVQHSMGLAVTIPEFMKAGGGGKRKKCEAAASKDKVP